MSSEQVDDLGEIFYQNGQRVDFISQAANRRLVDISIGSSGSSHNQTHDADFDVSADGEVFVKNGPPPPYSELHGQLDNRSSNQQSSPTPSTPVTEHLYTRFSGFFSNAALN